MVDYPRIRVSKQPPVPRVRLRMLPALLPLEIQLQVTATAIQWRMGDGPWQDLILTSTLDASVAVGTVTTLAPGSSATVANVGTLQDAVLNFGIPAGAPGAGAGTVTSVSVVSANGLAGSVANPTSTPALTLATTVTGVIKGDGTGFSAASAGVDFSLGTSALGTGILKSTTGTGALTIAVAGDFPTLNQNTSGSAASFTGSLAGDVGGTQGATVIGANKVANSQLAQMAAHTFKGNNTAGTANAIDLSISQVKTDLSLNNVDNTSDASKNSATVNLTNKRVVPRVTSISSSATPTINTDNCDAVDITALAAAITSMTTNLTGTPNNFDKLTFRIKDNGTARAITWGASFVANGVALPTTTVISKLLIVGFIWNGSAWGCVAVAQEA